MKLRTRLALTAVVAVLPVVVAMLLLQRSLWEYSQEDALEAAVLSRMQVERARCEATPETWRPQPSEEGAQHGRFVFEDSAGPRVRTPRTEVMDAPSGPRPKKKAGRAPTFVTLFPYDSHLVSRNPLAPGLVEVSGEEARAGLVSRRFVQDGQSVLDLVVRMPWEEGPCAFVLVRSIDPPRPSRMVLVPLQDWTLIIFTVVAAVVVALGSVIQRVRLLTEEVRASARSGYAQPVSVRGQDEISDLARAFQDARAEIQSRMAHQEAREQGLRDFLANTTHDVMTPLTVLQGHLSAMQRQLARGEPVGADDVSSAMSESHYMASLVHNLAAATRLEAGAPHVQSAPVDLNDVVLRVLGRHRPIARQRRIELEGGVPEAPVRVMGDVTLIEQAVSNVVGNGVRHGHDGGHVAVVLEGLRDGGFRLRVFDDGPGIPEEERTRILERGFRGNAARTRAPEGQGLGLHIAHHVARVHGWSLSLGPSEHGGLEVCFTFAGEGPWEPSSGKAREERRE